MVARVEVEGLRETVKSFKQAGGEANDLKDAFQRIGTHVAQTAKEEAPSDTGKLRSKIKAARRQNASVITSGGTTYHRYVHFGTKYVKANQYLYDAMAKEADWVAKQVAIEMDQLIERVF